MEIFKKYPYNVRIYQKKGQSYYVIQDRGRRVLFKDGTTVLRLRREKKDIPFPDFAYMTVDEGGRHLVDYYSPSEGEFFPMEIQENKAILQKYPVDKDVLFWFINDYQRRQQKYEKEKAAWEKLLPVLYIGIMMAGIGFAVIMTYDGLVKITAQAVGMQNLNLEFLKQLGVFADKLDSVVGQKQVIEQAVRPGFG